MATVNALLGVQWGDEGKGKWVDFLARDHDMIVRFQGGNNAGHTIYVDEQKLVLHLLPSGVLQPGTQSVISAGVVVDPIVLQAEIEKVGKIGHRPTPDTLLVSERAHVITPWHVATDCRQENEVSVPIGTTKRGIGPTYSSRVNRIGLTMGHLVNKDHLDSWLSSMAKDSGFQRSFNEDRENWEKFLAAIPAVAPHVTDADHAVREAMRNDRRVLLEGAQGSLLDLGLGTYPFVTSSATTVGGAIAAIGFDPRWISSIYGIAKAYVTRVGEGPFPTEIFGESLEWLRGRGNEYGATTNRPRRCGWFDAVAMRYAVQINGIDQLMLNKLDVLSQASELKIAVAYRHPQLGQLPTFPTTSEILAEVEPVYETFEGWQEEISSASSFSDLPPAAQTYCQAIEEFSGVKIGKIGIGPRPQDFIPGRS